MDSDGPTADPLDQLPEAYARALRLRAAGLCHDEIAERLGVHPEAVNTVLRLGEDKLRALLPSEHDQRADSSSGHASE